ncbi:MAG: class I SAM-dependent methyltransferase [Pseudomonadota bacterium]
MTEPPLDFRFDERVAKTYDTVRAHPPEVSRRVGEVLAGIVGPGGRIFEPGVGTGRIALPLVAAGCDVVGADLSMEMLSAMEEVRGTAAGRLERVQCDLNALPFRPAVFDGVLCVHVLHLIDDWASLLSSLVAMLKPGGVLILGRDWIDPASFAGMIRNEFRRSVVELSTTIESPPGARAFVQALAEQGVHPEGEQPEQTAAQWEATLAPAQLLDQIRTRDDAESWVLPDELLGRVMERLDRFAQAQWPSLTAPQAVTRRFVYSLMRKQ